MFVDNLSLLNFRNYDKGHVEFSKGINIIYGENATGKTNILESIYFLSTARSHRQASNSEMIKFGMENAKITADFYINEKNYKSEITLFSDKKKQIFINKVPILKTSELMEYLKTVLFCPEDLKLVKGAPRDRRRMLDLGLCQLKNKYFHALVEYTKVLQQKSKLLKSQPDSETMWVWNEKIAKIGAEVIWYRKGYLEKLSSFASKINYDISGDELVLEYLPAVNIYNFNDKNEIYNQFLDDINKNIQREIKFGICLIGPHRDDFKIKINNNDAKFFASQGQQRTAAISLKIAELEMIKEFSGENPILLLDDVLSELDEKRQKYIMSKINGVQVIITCTDAEKFKSLGSVKKISVEGVKE